MNAMLPGQNPLQRHMKWAADQQKGFLDRRREQAGYEEWKRRRQGKRPRPTPGPPPPPPPWQPWQGGEGVPPAPLPAPGPRVVERHHPVRAPFTFLVMLVLTAVAVLMADEVINALVALVVVGGVGLGLTFLATRSSWRDR